jgi:hypothetical protein
LRDLPEGALHGGGNLGIFTVDNAGDFERGFAIETGGGAVRFLGTEVAEIGAACFAF